jgi:hypothetical protein
MRPGRIEDWVQREYRLTGGGFSDYQAEVRGLKLCSQKLKEILEAAQREKDEVQWLPARVNGQGGESRPYWVLHFPYSGDEFLDVDRSRYGPLDEVVRGVLNLRKAQGRHVLPSPDGSLVSFVVSSKARDMIISEKCEGLDFEPYPS